MSVRAWLDRWGDWIIAVGLAAVSEYEIWVRPLFGDDIVTAWRAAAGSLLVLATLPLAWRRRAPVAVLFTVIGATAAAAFAMRPSQGPVTSFIALIVAFYSVGANCAERRALLGGGAGLAAPAVLIVIGQPGNLAPGSLAIFAAAWLTGRYLRQRRSQVSGLQDRAARLERDREEQARAAVTQERGRIARELHDIVAHSVSVMVIQAQAGQRLISDATQARTAFRSIEASGREALVELRRLLAILRTADDQLAIGPQPGFGSLESLIEQVREAGLPVDLRIEGQQVQLPPGVDLSAYRIVQEALTNTIKHAGPAKAEVVLRYHTSLRNRPGPARRPGNPAVLRQDNIAPASSPAWSGAELAGPKPARRSRRPRTRPRSPAHLGADGSACRDLPGQVTPSRRSAAGSCPPGSGH